MSRTAARGTPSTTVARRSGSTLEYTNAKSHELEDIAKEVPEVTSVTSLAGYEVLTEGRGSNAGTCIINLKNWADRKRTARQIIVDLEENSADWWSFEGSGRIDLDLHRAIAATD